MRRVYKVIGGSREVLEDIGAADLLPEGVAGDLILGIIPGAAAGDSAAAEMVRNRCRDEGITVEDFAARVVRALGRDGADRVGAGHVLGDSAHLPGTPRPERIAFGIRVSGNTKRSASRSSSGRYSNRGGSPRPPSSLGKAMAGPAMEFVYDEDPPRRSIDSAEQLSTVAGDHDHDESWTERSDETAGTGLGRAHEDMRIEYGKPPPFRMYVPSAVPIPRDQMSSEAPQPSTDYTLHGSPSQHSVALNHGSPPQHPLALNSSGSAPSTPRRIPSNSRTTPRSTQKGYDKGAFADRLDRLALDDALEGDSPVPSPGSTGYSSSFREVFGSGRGGR